MQPLESSAQLYARYRERMRKIADIRYAAAVLQWDQETYMPTGSSAFRGQQIATLSELAHQHATDPALGELLESLASTDRLDKLAARNIELSREDFKRQLKYPPAFVREMATQVNSSFQAWMEARKANSFSHYLPELDKLVALKREETRLLGFEEHPYDALLDEFEKGCTVSFLDPLFSKLLPELKTLLDQIMAKPAPDASFLTQHYPRQKQWDWGMQVIREMGFDFEHGRQDISEHPFTINFSSEDVRVTTRVDEQDLANMTWSCIHEAGHALYEQGLPASDYGLPSGEYCSLSIHESQSRIWENNIGRSLEFCEHYLPVLQNYFPQQLKEQTATSFYQGINRIGPSLIRTEADELTYHFHVFIRYELEKALIAGNIETRDIPGYWNDQYFNLLGLRVPDDKQGCLQDVHWSHGSFGYFPTYSLGSWYAAQFYGQAEQTLPDLKLQVKKGEFSGFLSWLREEIHQHGRRFSSDELCRKICGRPLDSSFFMNYLLQKYKAIYIL